MWNIEWTTEYILSQVSVVFAMVFLAMTLFIKNRHLIVLYNAISSIFFALQYLLIGAYSGLLVNMVSVVRSIWLFVDNKNGIRQSLFTIIATEILVLACGVLTYAAWWDIVAVVAGLVFNYCLWQTDVKVYRWLALVANICWIVYNALAMTLLGLISESVMFFFQVSGVIALYAGKNKVIKKQG